ncbi:S-adenosyl-L-methionine-dependent methyltransferase [Podospora appendiculata]|uniref:S-adenosyl-L-methionine-dependent methyltransferase n=1 Tax=Podospora appendiculata TaxID=314037 RepID=A0AAE1C864_9PEZI|nr:S-adenosyl-L-methionine-dependent methyltransferase [Podospora appendiculata]
MAPKPRKAAGNAPRSPGNPKPAVPPEIDPNSSFTPESFERELKALAAKAKKETWSRFAAEQASVYLRAIALLTLVAIYCKVSQLSLSPVYGSIPSSRWHSKLLMAAIFTGWSSNLFIGRSLSFKPALLLPIIAIYVPAVQFFLFKISGPMTAYWGPLVTEALTLFPLVTLSVACVATYLDGADFSSLPAWAADAAPGLGSYAYYKAAESLFGKLIDGHIGMSFFNTRLGMQIALAASYTLFAPSKLLLFTVPALLHTALLNTHVPTPMALASLNTTLADAGWMILDRQESRTGYISVIESVADGFRVMRCDHSLLGGEWVKFLGKGRFEGNQVAEPIYGVFAMLEAVRLVEVPQPIPDNTAKALVIGLGIGTTPAALVAHGIDTTVVEIDPVVHQFASRYFQLPKNHTAVIEDAVAYTARLAAEGQQRFDYIIHDVFTGGAEPIPLFTLEFLQSLDALLQPGGVVAINYAGDFALPPPKIVVQTIKKVFPSCRTFREHPRVEEDVDKAGQDFINMVVFCTKLDHRELSFREPTARDLLNSPSREAFLLPKYEVLDTDFIAGEEDGVLRRNDTQKLVKWHETSALGHWTVMRTVLPSVVWEAW